MKIKKHKDQFITSTNYWSFKNISTEKASIRRRLKYFINKFLTKILKLKIISSNSDVRPEQRSYIKDVSIIEIRNIKIQELIINHFSRFKIYLDKNEVLDNINEYDTFFRNSEISNLNGGMGYNNGLILFILCKHIEPEKIIESGVWRGYTTFLLDKASPVNAQILCYDINLGLLEFKSKKARYYEVDISEDVGEDHENFDFAFFDDHVSHYDRLNFCNRNNIKYIILDDDVSAFQTHSDGWPPIPTAAMIYDYENIPKSFEWVINDMDSSADISSIDVKPIIENYTRITFPSLSAYTGYRDTSFTSLLVKKQS